MGMNRRVTGKPITGQILLAVAVLGIVIISALAVARQRPSSSDKGLRDIDTAFSVPTHVGQPAPAITAVGVGGQPYTLTPGDGRPKAIMFYMGFG